MPCSYCNDSHSAFDPCPESIAAITSERQLNTGERMSALQRYRQAGVYAVTCEPDGRITMNTKIAAANEILDRDSARLKALIAQANAAVDLYDALKWVMERLDAQLSINSACRVKARAAIARAEGK